MNVSNTTTSQVAILTLKKDPITDDILSSMAIVFKLIMNPVLSVLGICGNTINMVVFYKMGLSDGVTQNFFILSTSDCMMGVIGILNGAAYILQSFVFIGQGGSAETMAQVIHWATMLAATFPQNFSLVTTVVIAVVRCCCVAMPLRVKYLITARRQMVAIMLFSSSSIIVLSYVIAPVKIRFVHNPMTNGSLAVFANIKWLTFTLFTGMFFYVGFFIVIICVIILTISLYQSSKFREKSTSASASSNSDSQTKDGRRETRIVKTVAFVSIVFIVCYLPTLVWSVMGRLDSNFSSFGFYRNAFALFLMIMEMSLLVNANVNILIYYFFNTRYRNILVMMFVAAPSTT